MRGGFWSLSVASARLADWVSRAGRVTLGLAVGLLILTIGVLDYVTGWESNFAVFYFLPVSIAAWYVSRRAGLLTALICMVAWSVADFATHPPYAHPAIAVWNPLARLAMFVAAAALLSALRENLEREASRARTDNLTGVANGFAFYETARSELNRSRRYNHPLTLAYLDIDDFKLVNDRLGHPAGDALIVKLADAIGSRIRASDLFARLGGDEFAILFPETGADEARTIIRKLRASLAAVALEDGRPITVSIGILTCTSPPDNLETLIARADALMYQAKGDNKNCDRFDVAGPQEVPTPEVQGKLAAPRA